MRCAQILSTAALLCLVASSARGATLAVSGECPGVVTIDILGASPSSNGGLVGGTIPGETPVPGGVCAGTPLGVDDASLLRRYTTDASGDHSITRTLADNLCGFLLQAIDLANCQTTTVESIPGSCDGWSEIAVSDRIVGPLAVATRDLDDDGDPDLVTAGWLDDTITWWENGGDGSTWTLHPIADGFDGAGSIAVADIDNDDDLDVVGASIDGEEIAWWENLGDAGSWAKHPVDASFSHPRSVTAADIDGDGDTDLVGAAYAGNSISWIENLTGDGSTWQKQPVAAGTFDGGISVRSGDLDGDGDLDVAAAGWVEGRIVWWQNDGNGGGWTERTVDADAPTPREIALADLDGDLDLDVVAALDDADTVSWYENRNGLGTLWTERTVDAGFDGASTIAIADIDGDGDPDIVGGAIWDDAVVWWENDGDGAGWAPRTLTDSFDAPYDVVVADFDGDGDLDTAGVAHLGNKLAWWENAGTGCLAVARP